MTAIYPDVATVICEGFCTKQRRSFSRAAQAKHVGHVGFAAPGKNRLQKSCRACGAQAGSDNAYNA